MVRGSYELDFFAWGLGKVLLMECFKKAVRLFSEVGIFAIALFNPVGAIGLSS